MPTNTVTPSVKTLWGRFLDAVLPASTPDRLVRVGETSRGMLPMAEGSLADAGITAVVQEIRSMNGESRFAILVPLQDASVAKEALSGI
jgi:hypothetical protein